MAWCYDLECYYNNYNFEGERNLVYIFLIKKHSHLTTLSEDIFLGETLKL